MQNKTESYYGGNKFLDLGFGKLEIKTDLSYILSHIEFISYMRFCHTTKKAKTLLEIDYKKYIFSTPILLFLSTFKSGLKCFSLLNGFYELFIHHFSEC